MNCFEVLNFQSLWTEVLVKRTLRKKLLLYSKNCLLHTNVYYFSISWWDNIIGPEPDIGSRNSSLFLLQVEIADIWHSTCTHNSHNQLCSAFIIHSCVYGSTMTVLYWTYNGHFRWTPISRCPHTQYRMWSLTLEFPITPYNMKNTETLQFCWDLCSTQVLFECMCTYWVQV